MPASRAGMDVSHCLGFGFAGVMCQSLKQSGLRNHAPESWDSYYGLCSSSSRERERERETDNKPMYMNSFCHSVYQPVNLNLNLKSIFSSALACSLLPP